MMKPKVYVTRLIPNEVLSIITDRFDCRVWRREDEAVPRETLKAEVAGAHGLYTMLTEKIDADLLDSAPNLRVVSNMAVGYDNIDVAECTKRGIVVCNTPGVLTDTTADLAFALLMAAARRVPEAERFVLESKWSTWSPMLLA